jgi:hypothetical protein
MHGGSVDLLSRDPADARPINPMRAFQTPCQYRNVIDTFLAGKMPNFSHERHVDVANVLHHLPYGRELMHLGLQVMAYRHGIPEKYQPASPTCGGTSSMARSLIRTASPTCQEALMGLGKRSARVRHCRDFIDVDRLIY